MATCSSGQHSAVMCMMSLRALILVALFLGLGANPRMGRGFGNPSRFSHRRTFGFYKPWGPWKPRSDPSQPRQAWGSRDNLPVGQRPRSLGAKLGSRDLRRKTFGLGVSPGLTIMTPHGMFITGFLSRQLGVEATFSLYHRFHHFAINSLLERFVEFQRMIFLKDPHTNVSSWDESYFANYYSK